MLKDGKAGQLVRITRERLLDGSLLAEARARAPAGLELMTDADLEASLDATLARRRDKTGDAWLFGYGSLMWNPAILYAERVVGRVHGWHRRYCFWVHAGRGSPQHPGLMLALDRGGSCRGVLYRIPAAEARSELLLAWRREMFGGSYIPRWVRAETARGPVEAVTFVANRANPRYAGELTDAEVADTIATAAGQLGTCASYLFETVTMLRSLGIADPNMERLRALVEARGHAMAAAS